MVIIALIVDDNDGFLHDEDETHGSIDHLIINTVVQWQL